MPRRLARARDADRDLAAVGDQQRADLGCVVRRWPRSPVPIRDARQRRTRHPHPTANPLRRQASLADPALDRTHRDAQELVGHLRAASGLIGHVAIVASVWPGGGTRHRSSRSRCAAHRPGTGIEAARRQLRRRWMLRGSERCPPRVLTIQAQGGAVRTAPLPPVARRLCAQRARRRRLSRNAVRPSCPSGDVAAARWPDRQRRAASGSIARAARG